jgi:hypothetical protein
MPPQSRIAGLTTLVVVCAALAVWVGTRYPEIDSYHQILIARDDPFLPWYRPASLVLLTIAACLIGIGVWMWSQARSRVQLSLVFVMVAVVLAAGIYLLLG